MLCCVCKEKEATVHLTQIAGEKMQKVDLCEECAKTKGVNDPTGFSLADLLLGLGAAQEIEQAGGDTGLKCPACGFTQADFKKAGRLGRDLTERIKSLQKKLTKAIEEEDFEKAAVLRDEIKEITARAAEAPAS